MSASQTEQGSEGRLQDNWNYFYGGLQEMADKFQSDPGDAQGKTYLVTYYHRCNPMVEAVDMAPSNVILRSIHPLMWAASGPAPYGENWVTVILWWAEIPDALAQHPAVHKWGDVVEQQA